MSGMSSLFASMTEQVMKSLPPETLEQIGQIGKTIATFNAKLDTILARQELIMAQLGIPTNQETDDDGPRSRPLEPPRNN